ncbi:dienelactone hydrolase family protein [Aerococcaceae bacterium zg-BR22]|uniref:alpha/beta fold hydrolase n=1 Tax=Aerococcaceae bacterium zg-1292 TaxID=2774330 RepID=UPI0040630D86|nr:dienelactone hydrolase family protein [Aerococcaceae bacterium zg-BR22]
MKIVIKIVISLMMILLIGVTVLFQMMRYQADASVTTDGAIKTNYGWHVDVKDESGAPIIFYQGALVDAKAYLPLAKALSKGHKDVYIIDAPLDLPIFARKQAEAIIKAEQRTQVIVMGHSLGGVVASQVATENKQVVGLALLASYPSEQTDVSQLNYPVLSLYGTNDKVLNSQNWTDALKRLPSTAEVKVIDGGNHAQFGNYGPQKGDGTAEISTEAQQQIVADKVNAIFK